MKEIKHSVFAYIDKRDNRVLIRVRWNNKQQQVIFSSGVYAQEDKWDNESRRAKRGTIHIVRAQQFTASAINSRIADFKDAIEECFVRYVIQNKIPSSNDLKESVNKYLSRNEEKVLATAPAKKLNFGELFEKFLLEVGREKNWDKIAKEKYKQAFQHIVKSVPHVSPDCLTIDTMYQLRDWYIENGYKNRTIDKQIVMLKSFLRWIDQQDGYSVPSKVLEFDPNLNVIRKTVTFLHYEELMAFANYQFEERDEYLAHARDLWCFMAYTSLRYSDLAALRNVHIVGKRIDMYTQKTNEHISVPLTEQALSLIEKYKGNVSNPSCVFDVISNQKLNDYIKDAAKKAGLDREIIDTYFVGTERREEIHKFHEIISCHDARRTFVSCSLAMGIPPEVVMKCTGHHSYNTMKPYIETATETQTLEMEKWNRNQYRSQIVAFLDRASEKDLKEILQLVKEYAKSC